MTAKEYLSQLKYLDIKLNDKISERERLISLATKVTPSYSADPVSTSGTPDKISNIVVMLQELEEDTEYTMAKMVKQKRAILAKLESMDNYKYYQLLYKKYVEYKDLAVVAKEMVYSYRVIVNMHGKALKEFEKLIK